jgi:hypothetical protein
MATAASTPPVLQNARPRGGGAPFTPAWGITVLRVGLGIIWSLNLLYILDPANQFFPTFTRTASSFGSSTLGGPSLPSFVARFPLPFELLIAGSTAYLAVALTAGITTRLACLVGAVFNVVLLLTQFATITTFPGSTDVGPQPLYLVMYLAVFLGSPTGDFSWTRWATGIPRTRPESSATPAFVSSSEPSSGVT